MSLQDMSHVSLTENSRFKVSSHGEHITLSPHTTPTTHQFKYDTLTSRWQKSPSVDKWKSFKHTMDSTVYAHRVIKNLNIT